MLAASGVHPNTAKVLARHCSITLTMDTYSHVMPAMLRDEAERLDALPTSNG